MSNITKTFPRFKLLNANVSNVQSSWEDQAITLNFSHIKADVSQARPASLKDFKEVCDRMCKLLHERLSVSSFTRVGTRLQYIYPQKNIRAVNDLLLRLPFMAVATDKLEPFGKEIKEQQRTLRVEDGERGYAIRIGSAQREISVVLPKPIDVDTSKFSPDVVLVDLDCYTTKKVDVEMLVAADYVRRSERTAEENLVEFVSR